MNGLRLPGSVLELHQTDRLVALLDLLAQGPDALVTFLEKRLQLHVLRDCLLVRLPLVVQEPHVLLRLPLRRCKLRLVLRPDSAQLRARLIDRRRPRVLLGYRRQVPEGHRRAACRRLGRAVRVTARLPEDERVLHFEVGYSIYFPAKMNLFIPSPMWKTHLKL